MKKLVKGRITDLIEGKKPGNDAAVKKAKESIMGESGIGETVVEETAFGDAVAVEEPVKGGERMKIMRVLSFINTVKQQFTSNPETYHQFMEMMTVYVHKKTLGSILG